MADAIGRNLQAVFKKCNAPAGEYHDEQGLGFEFKMAVPCDGHKDVAGDEK